MAYDIRNFQQEVIERSYQVPVLVDFWAEWCGPCKMLGPVLERMAGQNDGQWVLAKVNTEQFPQIAGQYRVQSIPNVKLFIDGEAVDEFVGALPEPAIRQWLEKAIPAPQNENLMRAKALLQTGQTAQALPLLESVLREEPGNAGAALLLAQIYLLSDPEKALAYLQKIDEAAEEYQEVANILPLAETLAQVKKGDLPAGKVREEFAAAIGALTEGRFENALQGLIAVLEKDRYYNEDASRKACIAIFKLLGEDHQLSRRYRPQFSGALYI